jgi:hypothetical protein
MSARGDVLPSRQHSAATATRLGLALSVAAHAVLTLAILAWWSPMPLEILPPPSVMVDLVSPEEIETPVAPEKPKLELPQPAPAPELFKQDIAKLEPAKPESAQQQQLKPSLSAQQSAPSPAPAQQPEPKPDTAEADKTEQQAETAARLAALLNLSPTDTPGGFDAPPSDSRAELGSGALAQFKSHLDKCWTPPAGAGASRSKIVIRLALKPNGDFAAEPALLQAPAAAIGPALVKSAMQALQRCRPYNFLPADKYREWRVLDLTFTPRGLSGS